MRRAAILAYKYVAVVTFVAMFIHCVALTFGFSRLPTMRVISLSPVAGLCAVMLSWLMRFCVVHRLCLGYVSVVSSCIQRQVYGDGFGEYLLAARLMMIFLGAIVLAVLITKRIPTPQCKKTKQREFFTN